MSKRDWRPGDVAAFTIDGERVNGIRTTDGTWTAYAPGLASGCVRSWIDRPWDGRHGQRPLIVIDPEDREQVERLWRAWRDLAPDHRLAQDNLHAALREFANPTPPKPEEPTGLGAVVEDAEGMKWVGLGTHFANGDQRWQSPRCIFRKYSQIAAVRVLSGGVQS